MPDAAAIARLVDALVAHDAVRDVKTALRNEVASRNYAAETLTVHGLRRALESLGLVATLKRAVVELHAETARAAQDATQQQTQADEAALVPRGAGNELEVVAAARWRWERITRDELVCFASEQNKPLVVPKRPAEVKTNSGDDDDKTATTAKPPLSTRFLYDSNDLLHVLQAIAPTNRSADASAASWGSIQLQLHSPSALDLCRSFAELAPRHPQLGVDDCNGAFVAEKLRVGDLVVAHQSVAMARQFAKTGCPVSLRAAVWRRALGIPTSLSSSDFEVLEALVSQRTYVTDDMYLLDLQRAVDSSDYFVFQDVIERVVLAFTRDADVLARAPAVNGAVRISETECVPPNGVLPFSGLVLYVAPLAYVVGDDAQTLYAVFKELYVRYWSRLNAVATILPLCKLFEDLVARSSPAAVFHLVKVGISPLSIAFPWIQSAFSGVVELQQLLLLWDRVVGFDTLELLAVFAAALFHWRAREWERVTTLDDARALYAELLDVHVVPLLQEYLFLLV